MKGKHIPQCPCPVCRNRKDPADVGKLVSFRLPKQQVQNLRQLAKATNKTMTDVMKSILNRFFNQ